MNNLYYMDSDGEYKPLGHIEEAELTSDSEENENISHFLSSEPMELTCTIENPEEIEKQIIYGGDRGRYNGHILQKDGYLSPENGWV